MAAGCIPIVIAKAGQLETVEHQRSGFLWNTLSELEGYTLQVAHDSDLRASLRQGAIARARDFSQDAFKRRLLELISSTK
jgi:glycosyltransferase involved in cell wall biosynthesis